MRRSPDKALILFFFTSFLFSVCLVLIRVRQTNFVTYYFLIWNLFLAAVPLCIAYAMYAWVGEKQRVAFYTLAALWFVFYPNAPYIITDFIHLKSRHNIPLWFDALLLFTFAWNGFVGGLISVRYFQLTALRFWPRWLAWGAILFVFVTASLGVYLGRFLRWNSWDILSNPLPLLGDVFDRIANPQDHPRTTAMTVLLSVFSLLAYLTMIHLPKQRGDES